MILDLHCHCHHSALWFDVDEPYWKRAEPLLGYRGMLRLSDTDNLIQVCNHGIAQNGAPHVRWAMDAYQIIKNSNHHVDWDWVVQNANRTLTSPQLFTTFSWLARELQVAIPSWVMSQLAEGSYSHHGLQDWSYRLDPPSSIGEIIDFHWHRFRLSTRKTPTVKTIALVPSYLRSWTNNPSFIRGVLRLSISLFKKVFAKSKHSA